MDRDQMKEGLLKIRYEHQRAIFNTLLAITASALFVLATSQKTFNDVEKTIFAVGLVMFFLLMLDSGERALKYFKDLKAFYEGK